MKRCQAKKSLNNFSCTEEAKKLRVAAAEKNARMNQTVESHLHLLLATLTHWHEIQNINMMNQKKKNKKNRFSFFFGFLIFLDSNLFWLDFLNSIFFRFSTKIWILFSLGFSKLSGAYFSLIS